MTACPTPRIRTAAVGGTEAGPAPGGDGISGRPFEEAMLFEIASAYEAGTKHRRPPKGFGPLKGEP